MENLKYHTIESNICEYIIQDYVVPSVRKLISFAIDEPLNNVLAKT